MGQAFTSTCTSKLLTRLPRAGRALFQMLGVFVES